MRYLNMAVLAGITIFVAGCQSSRQNEDKIMSELKNINSRLDKIDADLKKNTVSPSYSTQGEFDVSVSQPGAFGIKKEKNEALSKIKLPPNPTREDVKKYIRDIQEASKNQPGFSSNDPQVEMYLKLGEIYLDLLLDAMWQGYDQKRNFYIQHAINSMEITDASKDIIIKAFRKHPELINIITRNFWENDVKETMKEMLLDPTRTYFPSDLIQTAISFHDPEINNILLDHFINENNRAETYRLLKKSGIKINNDTIEKAWNNALSGQDEERKAMALIAVGYGYKTALETLLNLDLKTHYYGDEASAPYNRAIRLAVDCPGSMADIKKWYDANKSSIVCDQTDKKFKVKKADKATEKKVLQKNVTKIKLPPDPSRDDIRKYIKDIQTTSQNQHSWSPNDPQVNMYVQLGEENLDLLLDAMRQKNTELMDLHILFAMDKMPITTASKELLLKNLREQPEVISLIIRNGWQNEAKEAIKYLIFHPRDKINCHPDVILYAASLNDPEMNIALIRNFINCQNRAATYQLLKPFPHIKIDKDIIAQAWNKALTDGEYERNAMAVIAIAYGFQTALDTLLNRQPNMVYGPLYNASCDNAMLHAVDCTGSVADIKKWYEANKNNLVFDNVEKKFKVKKADATPGNQAP